MNGVFIVGILIGLLPLALSQWVVNFHLLSLINLPALTIVLGGTIASVVMQTPREILKAGAQLCRWFFVEPCFMYQQTVEQVVFWSKMSKQNDLLSVENSLSHISDPFVLKGAELLVAGVSSEALEEILEAEIDTRETRDLAAIEVFTSLGEYAPTFGILGSVVGLVYVMQTLTEPEQLSNGIALSALAIIYGIAFSNLIFFPMASKLKTYVYQRSRLYEMYTAGVVALANGESPRIIEIRMNAYVPSACPIKRK